MEENEVQEKPQKPLKKRKVSLFKRRKKPEIRPFVKQKKERTLKKILLFLFLGILIIFSISALLYGIRHLLIVTIFSRTTLILTPQTSLVARKDDIEAVLKEKNIVYTDLMVSTSSGTVSFKANETNVFLSREKNIEEQVTTLQAILRRISLDAKRASVVDLRYNKPIVKF